MEMTEMTTHEIAIALGKPQRTVQDWVALLSAKSVTVNAKLASSSSRYPASYTLTETCQIIEEGMGADVANTFRTNAVNAEIQELANTFKTKESKVDPIKNTIKVLSASQMLALEKIFGTSEACKRIDYAIGYKPEYNTAPLQITSSIEPLSKAGYAVEMKELAQRATRDTDRKMSGLF